MKYLKTKVVAKVYFFIFHLMLICNLGKVFYFPVTFLIIDLTEFALDD